MLNYIQNTILGQTVTKFLAQTNVYRTEMEKTKLPLVLNNVRLCLKGKRWRDVHIKMSVVAGRCLELIK